MLSFLFFFFVPLYILCPRLVPHSPHPNPEVAGPCGLLAPAVLSPSLLSEYGVYKTSRDPSHEKCRGRSTAVCNPKENQH